METEQLEVYADLYKKGSSDKTAINITTSAGFQQSDYTKKQFQQSIALNFPRVSKTSAML
jgi:hypothetical protein